MAEAKEDSYLRRIVAGAATINERLHGAFQPVASAESASLSRERLEGWRLKLSGAGPTAFERRLEWLGTSAEHAAPRLGGARFTGALPSWTEWLALALDAIESGPVSSIFACPFGALIAPFVEQARAAIAPAVESVFTAAATDALLGGLANELSHIAAPAFYLEFSALRSALGAPATESRSTAIYDAFVDEMLSGRLRAFFLDYPVLARLLATTLEDFVANSLAMAEALTADLPELTQHFAAGRPPGKVVGLRSSLSDRHNGGRTVSLLEFESGLKLVYKPRDIGIERAWFDLLAECNEAGGEFGLLRVVARKDHGWVEYARPRDCADSGEVALYYRRAGMLLAMLYAVEASDCFFENVVARGPWPLLIDMETLMHPVVRGRPDLSPAEAIADDIIFNSVFRAGFLPAWEMGPAGHCVDISGLGAEPGQVTSYVKRIWTDANTDAMSLSQQPISVDARDHLPTLDGEPARVADHVDSVIDGFTHAYRKIMGDGAKWLAPDAFARRFSSSEIRFVFHATRIYGLILKRLGAPRHMRSGVERSIEMDVISRFYLESHKQERFLPILEAEIAALDRLDIPKFTVRADRRSLLLPTGAELEDIFEESAIERVQRRVRSFSEDDLRLQSDFIRASLELAAAVVRHDPEPDGGSVGEAAPISPAELVAEARAIGAELSARAILSGDGGATWIAPQLLPGANRHEFRPLRMDLYSGLAGLALFFAALDRMTGEGRELALAALAPVRLYLRSAEPERMVRDGYTLGAATGAGSFLASLAWCSELLDEPDLCREAVDFSGRITPAWIEADEVFDVTSGSAGAILGLLCLYRRSGDPAVLAKATACGDHLLKSAQTAGAGVVWPAPGGGPALTGFSHGAAGIAAALDRLGAAAGAPRFSELAERAIAYENSVFDDVEGNWPDLRHAGSGGGESQFMNSWCHGAAGIGLGRAIGAGSRDGKACREDLDVALRSTERHGIGNRDGLCCGALGRADLFAVKAVRDADPAAEALARQWAGQVLHRRRRSGGYRLTGRGGQEFFDPSFFQGLSGIGYQLLRIADPRLLPSVLSWE